MGGKERKRMISRSFSLVGLNSEHKKGGKWVMTHMSTENFNGVGFRFHLQLYKQDNNPLLGGLIHE